MRFVTKQSTDLKKKHHFEKIIYDLLKQRLKLKNSIQT